MTLQTALHLLGGLAFLAAGADTLVRGAAGLAERLGVPALIVGLTVVAFGTSAPEALVTLESALAGETGIAVGNVIGSNIFNVLVILGLSALVAPLAVSRQVVRLDVPIMLAASILVLLFALNGDITRTEGAFLLAAIVAYTLFLIRQIPAGARSRPPRTPRVAPRLQTAPKRGTAAALRDAAFVAAGILLLAAGANWLITGAVATAQWAGVSEIVVGLTIVAAGTSLPELATSVTAALRGSRDIAVGNIVGSNTFNLLLVLGIGSVVAPGGLPIASATLRFDLPVMLAASFVCLPLFLTGFTLDRREGGALLAGYGAYLTYLILSAMGHESASFARAALTLFVAPALLLVLLFLAVRAWVEAKARNEEAGRGESKGSEEPKEVE